MPEQVAPNPKPDSTAERVALWRALHLEVDPPPHVLDDAIGLQLVGPDATWRQRPDMEPRFTAGFRAAIVARARFAEDLVMDKASDGISQYVILGAGLDTFAQRHPQVASTLRVFEVDRPEPQVWKRQRLVELGYPPAEWLHFVAVNFEAGQTWREELVKSGFDPARRAVVVSTGVSLYLTREANLATLRHIAALASGSTLMLSFNLPLELLPAEERPGIEAAIDGARASATPFVSFFSPEQMIALAREAGFGSARHVSTAELTERYFASRADGLRPSSGEQLLLAVS
jgi:methyltransferase (TIGR00027 family)